MEKKAPPGQAIPKTRLLHTTDSDFEAIPAAELLDMEIPARPPVISRIMPRGTFIFAGAPKVGKSWLVLWFAHQISTGRAVWDFETTRGNVLYLSLEDPVMRLKNRYMEIADDCIGNLHFVTKSYLVGDGFEEQLLRFIETNPDVSLIIIDTLQKIREMGNDRNGYAGDYDVMNRLKAIADDKNIALLIVHHTRKADDDDPFLTISGTNGLLGAADGAFVLVKNERLQNKGRLYATGRDIEDIELSLEFDKESCLWKLVSHNDDDVVKSDNPILCAIDKIVQEYEWSGTTTELLTGIVAIAPMLDIKSNVLSRTLNSNADLLLSRFHIRYSQKRVSNVKLVILTRVAPAASDMSDMCGIFDTPPDGK